LTSPTVLEPPVASVSETKRAEATRAFLIVFACTFVGAVAQILMKLGTAQLGSHVTLTDVIRHPTLFVTFCIGVITNVKLFMGYCLLGVQTVLMAMALKGQELSKLYPIIALTYVWVILLSLILLPGEHMNFFRSIGIAFIVGGVSVLGMKK
jgi:uncharacterized membrane protein